MLGQHNVSLWYHWTYLHTLLHCIHRHSNIFFKTVLENHTVSILTRNMLDQSHSRSKTNCCLMYYISLYGCTMTYHLWLRKVSCWCHSDRCLIDIKHALRSSLTGEHVALKRLSSPHRAEWKWWMGSLSFTDCSRLIRECTSALQRTSMEPSTPAQSSKYWVTALELFLSSYYFSIKRVSSGKYHAVDRLVFFI